MQADSVPFLPGLPYDFWGFWIVAVDSAFKKTIFKFIFAVILAKLNALLFYIVYEENKSFSIV